MDNEAYDHFKAQEALQEQSLSSQTMMNAPAIHEAVQQNQAILVEQTNPRNVVDEILLRLKGYEKDPTGMPVKVGKPWMNDDGLDNVRYILSSYINQNTILTHLKEPQITKMINQVGDDVVDDLTLNWKRYGISDKTKLDHIVTTILINVFNALSRALGQNEKNWLGRISVENISNTSKIPNPKGGGFLSKFRL